MENKAGIELSSRFDGGARSPIIEDMYTPKMTSSFVGEDLLEIEIELMKTTNETNISLSPQEIIFFGTKQCSSGSGKVLIDNRQCGNFNVIFDLSIFGI